MTDLVFQPLLSRQFYKYLKAAFDILADVLINSVLGDYSPCVTDIMLKNQATDFIY